LQALIDFIIRNLLALWPLAVVEFNERGLLIRLGKVRQELEPGLHWRWWFIERVAVVTSTEDFIDLPFGDAVTRDGVPVTFSANVGFKIISPMRMWQAVHDVDENLSRLALGQLSTTISKRTYDEHARGNEAMRTWLKQQLERETSKWGIEITQVYITTLSKARQIRLLKDGGE
jgi:regulator of protease activity HflC (stomatin/prohibitin superfamily)